MHPVILRSMHRRDEEEWRDDDDDDYGIKIARPLMKLDVPAQPMPAPKKVVQVRPPGSLLGWTSTMFGVLTARIGKVQAAFKHCPRIIAVGGQEQCSKTTKGSCPRDDAVTIHEIW